MILDCNGELFFATHTIETYLGFHQSDVIHQSVYELVHSEDREELQRQLGWDSFLGQEDAGTNLQELLNSDHNHSLDRSFTVRFRCLLDNTSGFLVRIKKFSSVDVASAKSKCKIVKNTYRCTKILLQWKFQNNFTNLTLKQYISENDSIIRFWNF